MFIKMEGLLNITPISAIRNVRSLTEVYQRHEHFYRRLKKTDQKRNVQRSFKIRTVEPALYRRSPYNNSIHNDPDFSVSISQSARNRIAHSDVIDLVPTNVSAHTIVFEPLSSPA